MQNYKFAFVQQTELYSLQHQYLGYVVPVVLQYLHAHQTIIKPI